MDLNSHSRSLWWQGGILRLGWLMLTLGLLAGLAPQRARAQCNFNAVVRNQTVTLGINGTVTVLASDFDNGSTSACGPLTFTMQPPGTVSGSVAEGRTLTLTAPGGALFTSVLFASYGTPGSSPGSYTIGGCHASNSINVVQPYLLNRNSGNIGANNGTFGDPCNGTVKTLAVKARYNQASGPYVSQATFSCFDATSSVITSPPVATGRPLISAKKANALRALTRPKSYIKSANSGTSALQPFAAVRAHNSASCS